MSQSGSWMCNIETVCIRDNNRYVYTFWYGVVCAIHPHYMEMSAMEWFCLLCIWKSAQNIAMVRQCVTFVPRAVMLHETNIHASENEILSFIQRWIWCRPMCLSPESSTIFVTIFLHSVTLFFAVIHVHTKYSILTLIAAEVCQFEVTTKKISTSVEFVFKCIRLNRFDTVTPSNTKIL